MKTIIPPVLFLSLTANCWSQTLWANQFKDASVSSVPLDAGFLVPLRADVRASDFGYTLNASSQRTAGGQDYQALSLVRFDGSGTALWNARLDTGAAHAGVDLYADPGNEDLLFGVVNDPGNTTFRYGLLNGETLTPFFVKEFTKSAQSAHSVTFFNSSLMGSMVDNGGSIDAVAFDGAGATVFDKRYSSPVFSPSLGLSVQSVLRELMPSGTSIGTSVALSSTVVVGAEVSGEVRLTPFFTDLSGEVTSATTLTFSTGLGVTGIPFPTTLADDSLLYRVPDTILNPPVSSDPITHFIKVSPSGTVDWAKTISSGRFTQISPTPDRIYLGGSIPKSGGAAGESQAAVIVLNMADGTLLSQAVYGSVDEIDSASVLAAGSNVHVTINSFSFASPQVGKTTLVNTNSDLSSHSAVRYLEEHLTSGLFPDGEISSANRFVFSASSGERNDVRAYSLDSNLAPLFDCEIFEESSVSTTAPLTLADLPVVVSPVTVTATDIDTASTDSSLPITGFELENTLICEPQVMTKGIDLEADQGAGEVTLSFPTLDGVEYSIRYTEELGQGFTEVATRSGTGSRVSFVRPLGASRGFFKVFPAPPVE